MGLFTHDELKSSARVPETRLLYVYTDQAMTSLATLTDKDDVSIANPVVLDPAVNTNAAFGQDWLSGRAIFKCAGVDLLWIISDYDIANNIADPRPIYATWPASLVSLGISTSLTLADNAKAYFGTSLDYNLYCDGTYLYLKSLEGQTAMRVNAKGGIELYPCTTLGVDNAAGFKVRSNNDATSFFVNTGNDKRSYLVRVEAYRPSTLPMGDGVHGVDDAAIYGLYRSYAADAAYCQQRGVNFQVRHSGVSAGSLNNLIGTNVSTSTVVAGDVIALMLSNENYAPSTAGVSGCLDLVHTHEGPNAVGGEFGIRVRNAKKNGSVIGAYIMLDDATCTTEFAYGLDMNEAKPGTGDIRLANGMIIQSRSTAVSDGDATTLPKGSLVTTSNGTGGGTLFISDGTNLQAIALA